jgi:putative transposase
MPNYRRAACPGGTYFFTVNTFRRQPVLTDEPFRAALRHAIRVTQRTYPFDILAWVLLPDHLHVLWRLPDGDAATGVRWSLIKGQVTQAYGNFLSIEKTTTSRYKRREGTLWQRRFWERLILDDADFERHFDYIHINPVKHGYVTRAGDWPYSTFHRYVKQSVYPSDWAAEPDTNGEFGEFG